MELTPSESKEVIAREFDQNINTLPPPKLKRANHECRTKLNITIDTPAELHPSETEKVIIAHEFDQDVNTHPPPPKLKSTILEDACSELPLSELKDVITHEFDQDINTLLLPPKLKRVVKKNIKRATPRERGANTLKTIADGIEKNTHLTRSDTSWIPQAMDYRVKITEQGVEIIFKPPGSVEPKVDLPNTSEEMLY